MLRVPPALWLLGLAVAVSLLTREAAPRAGPAAPQAALKATAVVPVPRAMAPAGPDAALR